VLALRGAGSGCLLTVLGKGGEGREFRRANHTPSDRMKERERERETERKRERDRNKERERERERDCAGDRKRRQYPSSMKPAQM